MGRNMCDYSIIQDTSFTLGRDIDKAFRFATGPGFTNSAAILGLRALNTGTGRFRFRARLNSTDLGTFVANDGAMVTIHEVVPSNVLKETDNELTVTKQGATNSSGEISDVVLWWQRDVG